MKTRYSFGGDEHIFVECDEEMSLEAFFKGMSITTALRDAKIKGVTEICPANASFQVRFDPDVIAPEHPWLMAQDRVEFRQILEFLRRRRQPSQPLRVTAAQ